ncbi:mechanosensitive ion channel protein MscS [Candidatus Endobugula sertula]|uniref:Mechanosensitive ion channel protein MscS n=1 Tax=Candidatus Endobugula sertula TaxID=62101 RepID=A0A1D2QNY1_9GAMM|nr:mechanosensitive ion channel protein MscS [Candidatus Endobugula sertula]
MQWVDQFLNFLAKPGARLVHVFIIVLCVLAFDFFQRKILHKLLKHVEDKTKNFWDDALLHSARRPISLVLWMAGLSIVNQLIYRADDPEMAEIIGATSHVGIVIAITWFVAEFIGFSERKFITQQQKKLPGDESRVDSVTIEALCKLLRLSIIITSGIVILDTLGFSISGVLAFGGIGGIAVGFAAKDLLSNFFGGLMVYLDRPFAVGDWVRSNDRDIEGTIEYIGWRQTRIRTFSKRPIYVPNSVFSTIVVENPSRMSHRRIYETLGIRYDDIGLMDAIVDSVVDMLNNHPDIDTTQTMIVNFNAFSSSSIDFFVYTFTKTTDWVKYHEVKQNILLKIANIVTKHGAEFAFPTSTLHVYNETEPAVAPELAGLFDPKQNSEQKP